MGLNVLSTTADVSFSLTVGKKNTSSRGRYINLNLLYIMRQLLALSLIECIRWWSMKGCKVTLKEETGGFAPVNVKNVVELETHSNVLENCGRTWTAALQTVCTVRNQS